MTSTRISVYWPNGWAPDFPRVATFPELQWLIGAQESCESANGPLEISNHGLVDPRQSRRRPARLSSESLLDWMFSFCSHGWRECLATLEKIRGRDPALVEADVAEGIATSGGDVRAVLRATLIANAYLEAEIERLTQAISTGFARGRMRKAPQRVTKI